MSHKIFSSNLDYTMLLFHYHIIVFFSGVVHDSQIDGGEGLCCPAKSEAPTGTGK